MELLSCLVILFRGIAVAEGSHWRLLLENALISGKVGRERTRMVTLTQHLTTSSA